MNEWTLLDPLPEEPYPLDAEAAKLRNELNGRISAILADRAALDQEREQIDGMAIAELDSKHLKRLDGIPMRRRDLLVAELWLREEIKARWLPLRSDLRIAARVAATEALTKISEEIKRKMIAIGFLDEPGSFASVPCHPDVRQARVRLSTLDNLEAWDELARQNQRFIEELKLALEAMRQRILARV